MTGSWGKSALARVEWHSVVVQESAKAGPQQNRASEVKAIDAKEGIFIKGFLTD